ncbi:MAG TPA: WD40 repeat domain-containing protein [Candidatus Didemnitutus sp.]
MSSFTEDLRGFFFGREKETEELVRLVRRNTLTVLFGQSGLGKSSLLQAGVFPLLREADFLPLYLRLDHDPSTPPLADQVKAALVAAIQQAGAEAPAPRADESLWEYFHRKDVDIWSAKNRLLTPVLAFDQFEEIFTLGRANEARRERGRAFLTELADLVENRPPAPLRAKFDSGELDTARYNFDKPSCQVILSLREDFLPDLEGLKNEMRSLMHNRMRIRRLTGTQALEIVTRPAPHLLAEGVAERVVEFVAGARGGSAERLEEMEVEPSLLSVICRELNQRRRTLGQAQITADLVSGNRREILNDFYERSVSDLPPAMRQYVEDHLLTKSGFRDNVALETVLEAPGVTRSLVDTLVSRRLLRIEDRLGVQRVELTHDVLADVISASRDSRREREALDEAKRQLTVQKEREAATRRSLVRARFIAAVAIVVMLLAAGSAFFGWINLRRARAAETQAQQARAGETKLREQAQTDELAARRRAYASEMNVAMQALRDSNLGRAVDLLNLQRPQPGQTDLRGWEWRYLWQQTRSDALATVFRNGNGEINSLAVSPDDRLLAIGIYHQGGVIIQDLSTHQQLAHLVPNDAQVRAAFSPTEPLLAFCSTDLSTGSSANGVTRLHLWNTTTREQTAAMPLNGICLGLAFSADGRTLVTSDSDASGNGQIALWRMPDGTKLASFATEQSHLAVGTIFAASADLSVAAYSMGGGRVRVVGLNDGRDLWTAAAAKEFICALAFSPDGKTLATAAGFNESDIRLWDVAAGTEIGKLEGHKNWVSSLVFFPDGKTLASASADQTIRTWDLATRKCLDVMRGHRNEVWRLALQPDGRTLVSGSKDGEVSLWDESTLHPHRSNLVWPEPVSDWRFAAEGRAVVTVNSAGQVAKWTGPDYQQKELLLEIGANTYPQFSHDGGLLAAKQPDGHIRVWDTARRILVGKIKTVTEHEFPTAILDHRKSLLTHSLDDNHERIWDLATNREVQGWASPALAQIGGVSPDERWEASIGIEGTIFFRDLPAQRSSSPKLDLLEPSSTGFSPDGKLLAVSSNVGYVRVWEIESWREVATLRGYSLGVHGGAFSPDGRRLATGGGATADSMKLWDTESWTDVLTLDGLGGTSGNIGFSADGSALGITSGPGYIQIWQAPSWAEINAAEKAAPVASAAAP